MAITAAQVKELREMTGAGIMECKKALTETNGNIDEAVELLRKAGAARLRRRQTVLRQKAFAMLLRMRTTRQRL